MKKGEKEKNITFKFSLDPEKDIDIIYYIKSIKNKNMRGEWITEAVKTYKMIESTLKTLDREKIRKSLKDCLEKIKKEEEEGV